MKKNKLVILFCIILFCIIYIIIPGFINSLNPLSKPAAVYIAKNYLKSNYNISANKIGKVKNYFLEPGYFEINFVDTETKSIDFYVYIDNTDFKVVDCSYGEKAFEYVLHKDYDRCLKSIFGNNIVVNYSYDWDKSNNDFKTDKGIEELSIYDFNECIQNFEIEVLIKNMDQEYDYAKLFEFIKEYKTQIKNKKDTIHVNVVKDGQIGEIKYTIPIYKTFTVYDVKNIFNGAGC